MLKAGFRKCHHRPQHRLPLGCELRALCSCVMQRQANTNPPHLSRIPTKCRDNGNCTVSNWLKLATNDPASCKTRFTRGRVQELKNGHNSVTVQNRTHVYMNFFHHKDLGNHILQLCPKVVKHPVLLQSFCYYPYTSNYRNTTVSYKFNMYCTFFKFNFLVPELNTQGDVQKIRI